MISFKKRLIQEIAEPIHLEIMKIVADVVISEGLRDIGNTAVAKDASDFR